MLLTTILRAENRHAFTDVYLSLRKKYNEVFFLATHAAHGSLAVTLRTTEQARFYPI